MSEQAPQVDESKFNAMQMVAAAEGPEAEARRQEMDRWAQAQGALAETAMANHAYVEKMSVISGASAEAVADEIRENAKATAQTGVRRREGIHGERDQNGPLTIHYKARKDGSVETENVNDPRYSKRVFRSPAHIRGDK